MKLTLREKILISIFLMTAFIAVYYQYLIIPQQEQLGILQTKNQALQERIEEIDYFITSNSPIKDSLQAMEEEFALKRQNYFVDVNQEQLILLLDEILNQSGFKINNIAFLPIQTADLPLRVTSESNPRQLSTEKSVVKLSFSGNYANLIEFLNAIENYQKQIIIDNLQITFSNQSNLSGSLEIAFYKIPMPN